MRKLDLTNYTVSIPDPKGIPQILTYQFQKSLGNILLDQRLGLNGDELLKSNKVAEKVKNNEFFEVLLDEDDYKLIVDTLKRFRGFTLADVKLVKRIYDCTTVPDEKSVKFSDDGKEKK